jgi:hypothetical protein
VVDRGLEDGARQRVLGQCKGSAAQEPKVRRLSAGANEIRTLGPRGRQRLRDRPLLLFRRSCSSQKHRARV